MSEPQDMDLAAATRKLKALVDRKMDAITADQNERGREQMALIPAEDMAILQLYGATVTLRSGTHLVSVGAQAGTPTEAAEQVDGIVTRSAIAMIERGRQPAFLANAAVEGILAAEREDRDRAFWMGRPMAWPGLGSFG